jgi:diguanylate cyclase (GGDEF)-like protein
MSISTQAEAIKIPQQQADLLSALLRLPPASPVDSISRLVLKDSNFCDRVLDIVFPRRPPSITEAIIHESIRELGVERIRLLFLSNNIAEAFSSARMGNFDEGEFWVNAIRRGCVAYRIAEEVNYPDKYEAFITGFMSDIGTVLLAARFPHMSEHLKDARSRPADVRANIERIILGSNHCEEVQRSGLTHLIPPRIIQAIIGHLDPYPGNDRKALLISITGVAVALGDVANTIPANTSYEVSERLNKNLSQKIDLESTFESALEHSVKICKDLGYMVPEARSIESFLQGAPPESPEEDDPLANLFRFTMEKTLDNRTGFFEKLGEHLKDPNRRDDLSILIVDLDSFAKINDTYGCPTADSLLQYLGQEISRSMRAMDHVAKIDADQFALLLPKTQAMGAKVVAERIRSLVKGSTIAMGTIRPNCTASVGGVTIHKDSKNLSPEKVWSKVGELLQMAKDKGKNRIIWAS